MIFLASFQEMKLTGLLSSQKQIKAFEKMRRFCEFEPFSTCGCSLLLVRMPFSSAVYFEVVVESTV